VRGFGDTSGVYERLVDQLLVELDGLEELHEVVVIGATNRPDLIDPSLLRPGRFDKILFIPLPDREGRKGIFSVQLRRMPLAKDVSIDALVDATDGFTGADIAALCKEAGLYAIRENKAAKEVSMKHFKQALEKIKPSLSKEEIAEWDRKAKQYSSGRA
jgi:transitional endoplasmic reticulum ATPase